MADSKRLAMLKELTTLLEGITPANGFAHDLTANVYRGRFSFGTEVAGANMVSIIEAPEQLEPDHVTDSRVRKVDLKIQIWGVTASQGSTKNPSDEAYALLANVVERLSLINDPLALEYFLGGLLVSPLAMDTGVVRCPEEGICKTPFFVANLVLTYVEDLMAP